MFARSYIDEHTENSPLTSTLVEGRMSVSLKEAINTPIGLKRRILQGEDPLTIWFEAENIDLYSKFALKTGIHLDSAHLERRKQIMPLSKDMTPPDIYGFCKSIGVHPVHLVPLDSDPRLSLPIQLLHLLIEMSKRTDKFDAEQVRLAKLGIAFEHKRINKFLYERRYIEESNTKFASVEVNLRDTIDDVLSSPIGVQILSREFKFYSGTKASQNLADYPLLSILRNVAYYLAGNKNAQLIQKADRLEEIFEFGRAAYRKEFAEIVGNKKDAEIWFLADIRDALFEEEIESVKATIEDIEKAIWTFLPNDSRLNDVFKYTQIRLGKSHDFKDASQEFVTSLASKINFYFLAEEKFCQAKKRNQQCAELKVTKEASIYEAFSSSIISEGTVYRRLIENRIALAILSSQNPISQPK